MYKLVAVTLLASVVYVAADCSNCEETECCIMGLGVRPFGTADRCEARGEDGDRCSELPSVEGKYPLKCPCKVGFECKVGDGLITGPLKKKCRPSATAVFASTASSPVNETGNTTQSTLADGETTLNTETTTPNATTQSTLADGETTLNTETTTPNPTTSTPNPTTSTTNPTTSAPSTAAPVGA